MCAAMPTHVNLCLVHIAVHPVRQSAAQPPASSGPMVVCAGQPVGSVTLQSTAQALPPCAQPTSTLETGSRAVAARPTAFLASVEHRHSSAWTTLVHVSTQT